MFSNYLKITLAVMQRRKFFTFISLFGISITLTILILMTAFYEHLFGQKYPEKLQERTLYSMRIDEEDTIQQGIRSGPMSVYFIKKYIETMKTPEKVGYATMGNTINTYGNGKKLKLYYKYTDPNFWDIVQFEFLEGKAYQQQQFDNNEQVAVINDITRDDYFGKGVQAVGKTIEFDGLQLRVIGVIRGCAITRMVVSADIYMPYYLEKRDQKKVGFNGSYIPMVLAKSPADFAAIQAEYEDLIPKIPIPVESNFKPHRLKSRLSPYFNSIVGGTFISDDDGTAQTRFYIFSVLFALLFMSLPAINLVNINVSRIMERSSEIGIRKAFGASSKTLVYQFVIENILMTIIGGVLALVISALFIWWFNGSGLIAYADLTINWTVVVVTLTLSVVFGLMSGVLPAWRMSKLPIVDALKG